MANRSQVPAARSHGSAAPHLQGAWLTRGADGRFSAYLPRNGEVVRWTEQPDGSWSGPDSLGGDGLDPFLAVGQGADRYVHLVGLRPVGGGEGNVELVHSVQFQTGRPAAAWRSIGHSNGKSPWTGNPSVTVDAQGRAYVFVRNAGGGLSVRAQKDAGGWHPWWDLHGWKTDASPVAVCNGEGRVELLTATEKGLFHYVQEEPGGRPVRKDPLPAEVTFGTLAAVTGPSGNVTLFYVDKTAKVRAWSPGRSLEPTVLGDAAGTGRLSATRCLIDGFDCTVLAQQSADGRLALAAYPSEKEDEGIAWAETGEPRGELATVLTRGLDGRLVAMSLVGDSTLITTRQKATAEGLLLEGWRSIG
ncbi:MULTISPECIES: hypothetical protein [unclassified Streptomyces]|uniref:hypothetical protein n=1 Tax=unclassified Streptomyces TaxID=2593676 RepID=UPI0016602757|nr:MULTISPECIES: hypothetical protein [unclassified Streptomyces]MBD0709594.1 hypothetical protein [Streptomyces sp. CBMA291]MBD0714380.1 hypothetical protein [Streptomyces sp. CBMA370]